MSWKPMFKGNKKGANPFVGYIATHFLWWCLEIPMIQISGKEFTPLREPSAILFSYQMGVFQTFHKGEQERQAQYVLMSILILCFMP